MSDPSTPTLPDSALPPEGGADYAAQMIARADGDTPPPKPEDKKPEEQPLIAGKFKTQDDLIKAYNELQKKLGAPKPPEGDAPKPGEGEPKRPVVDPTRTNLEVKPEDKQSAQAQQVVKEAGLNWDELNSEWASSGELAEASYKKLEKAGIPKEMVDQFINGQIAAATLARNAVFETVGGEDNYTSIVQWAAKNMSAEEVAAYNGIVNGRDMAATKIAVAGLKARFDASNGSEPTLIGGDGPSGSAGYKSAAELKRDMNDPRYASDAAFRKEVENKLRVSSIL